MGKPEISAPAARQRFTLSRHGDMWIVWDSEERMIVDTDRRRAKLAPVVRAMNSLDRKLNHSAAQ